ncbi:MAG: SDR family oxidoreductase [Chloroflexota bacterium]|nr:MAG: SDR family oxidoreductase [Chloroflexota bacterium]
MDLGLHGKKALITGSSRGLGFATAKLLAQEGCDIAINSRDQERLAAANEEISAESNGRIFSIIADVSLGEDADRLVKESAGLLGGLDILITNSGGPPSGKFETFDDQTWVAAINLNFLSHVRLIRTALPYLKDSSSASVLTITSMSVKQPVPNLVLSNSVRSATVGLTKTLALELGDEGIRFNSILPGWTETERVQELMAFRAENNKTTIDEELTKQAKDSPLGRLGSPKEFANMAVFLASPAASYLTGSMIVVDGGMYKATY